MKSLISNTYQAASGWVRMKADQYNQKQKAKKYLEHEEKAGYKTRLDIKDWAIAEQLYTGSDPKSWALQTILADVAKDALLSSQKENRIQQVFSAKFSLKKPNGDEDVEQTAALKSMPLYRFLTRAMLDSNYFENSLVELSVAQTVDGRLYYVGDIIPRTNVVAKTGLFYPDYMDDTKKTSYRDMPEFGIWILEFWSKEMPMLNKAVPHVLFKRFAQSCWSELCEIFGIPPRVLKTNTQDKNMMQRATKMMKDMGAASWFIIDEDEEFEFAQGATTNGDVYKNLIAQCSNEICLLIVGAILAQDTKNGSRSKDEVATEILWLLVQSDMAMLEEYWNNIIIPAFKQHGIIKGDVTFEFLPSEDTNKLFDWAIKLAQYYKIAPEFWKDKFGIEVLEEKDGSIKINEDDAKKLRATLFGESDFFGQARRRNAA